MTTTNTRLLLVGEVHGQPEGTHQVKDLISGYVEQAKRVVLALEMPPRAEEIIEKILSASNHETPTDKWAGLGDGRDSVHVWRLLREVGRIRALSGVHISTATFDANEEQLHQTPGANIQAKRELAMAQNLAKLCGDSHVVIALMGNLHARVEPGAPWDKTLVWTGVHVVNILGHEHVASYGAASFDL